MDMEGVKTVFIFCVLFGSVALCLILVIAGILRWLAPRDSRHKRLNVASWVAMAVLVAISWLYCARLAMDSGTDRSLDRFFLETFNIVIGFLLIAIPIVSVIVLLLIAMRGIFLGWQIFAHGSKQDESLSSDKDKYIDALKSPVVTLLIACGIVALFILFPLFMGQWEGSLIDTWLDGVNKVGSICDSSSPQDPKNNTIVTGFPTYAMIYTIAIGVGFAVVRILRSVISHSLRKDDNKKLIDEYSDPIALLAVGVSLLWSLREGKIEFNDPGKTLRNLIPSFVVVVAIFAIILLILEVIRTLMDMRERLIRKEARYLFIFLSGQCAMMLMDVIAFACSVLNDVAGDIFDNRMDEIETKLRDKVISAVKKEMKKKTDDKMESQACGKASDKVNFDKVFVPFEEKVMRK